MALWSGNETMSMTEDYLDVRDRRRKAIDEALAQADKGVFISQELVETWGDSLGTDNELPPPEPDIFLNSGIHFTSYLIISLAAKYALFVV